MTRRELPTLPEDLRGLRAARWTRESTSGQVDRFGPMAQRDQQDRAIERLGLVDSGRGWSSTQSGRTAWRSEAFADMLATAGVEWDVLVVGYVSRFLRNLKQALIARDGLHERGAVIVFADERILSSEEDRWDEFVREAHEAESYSRKLSRRVREGFAAKRRLERDPGSGEVSIGFRRVGGLVEPDPETIPLAVEIYRRSAGGETDRAIASALGIGIWPVRTVLRSPLYGGHLADGRETRFAAPVPVELVEAAHANRHRRATSGRQHGHHRIYPLTDRGPLVCARCDRPLKGVFRTDVKARLYRHPDPCVAWRPAETRAAPLEEQVGWMLAKASPSRESTARIRAALAQPVRSPDRLAVARLDAELRRLALTLVDRPDPAVVRRLDEVRAERDRIADTPLDVGQPSAEEALDWLSDVGRLWRDTTDAGRRALAVATFTRLGAVGSRIVDVEATPFAERRGIALALPTRVTGVGGTGEDDRPVTWPIEIVHRRAWLAAARSA